MRKAIILLLILGFSPAGAFAAPGIDAVNGNVLHKNLITVWGSAFGAKVPAQPYFYDDFESGTAGQPIVGQRGTVGTPVWQEYLTKGKPVYDTSQSYGQGKHAAHVAVQGNSFKTAGIDGLRSTSAYLSYRFRWNASSTNWENAVYKLSRVTAQGGLYSPNPKFFPQYQPGANWAYDNYDNGDGGAKNKSFSFPSQNTWNRAEVYMKLSVPAGAANGFAQSWYNLKPSYDARNVVTRSTSVANSVLDSFILPFDIANNSSNFYRFWADDVYFDITQARVEIGNAATFSACTKREIQIPQMWSNGAITLMVNQGSFSQGEKGYLYVVDADGVVNASGYPIQFGAGTSAPAPEEPAPAPAPVEPAPIPAPEEPAPTPPKELAPGPKAPQSPKNLILAKK